MIFSAAPHWQDEICCGLTTHDMLLKLTPHTIERSVIVPEVELILNAEYLQSNFNPLQRSYCNDIDIKFYEAVRAYLLGLTRIFCVAIIVLKVQNSHDYYQVSVSISFV